MAMITNLREHFASDDILGSPMTYVGALLVIALLALVFYPNIRDWLRHRRHRRH